MFDQLKEKFPLLQTHWDEYARYYHRMEVPPKTVLLKEGDIARRAYLIEKGCLRVWFNHKGKDITFQFAFEKEALSGAESFRKNIPSFFSIETIEPSVLHWIHKKDMQKILLDISRNPETSNQLLDSVFERQFHYMRHFLSFIKDSPEERYLYLLREKPHIIERVPLQYIATYLGITPVSLSRIRNRLAK